MKNLILLGFLACSCALPANSQTYFNITGSLVDQISNRPIYGAVISIDSIQLRSISGEDGSFILKDCPPGYFSVSISMEGYELKLVNVTITNASIVLDQIALVPNIFELKKEEMELLLTETDLQEEGQFSNHVSGVFHASKDEYLRSAAFNFGQAWYKIRGYDSGRGAVLINGIPMNKIGNHRPQWSNWGGLNDIFKNAEFNYGLSPSQNTFGDILGTTDFTIRASLVQPMKKLSLGYSNKSYATRVMASYASGIGKNEMAYTISLSRRGGDQGYVPGTSYESLSGILVIEKIIDKRHSLNFMALGARTLRGKSSPNTNEITRIKGKYYNAYWGYYNGNKRNSRRKDVFEPIIMLNHFYKNSRTDLTTTISFQKGSISNSRLGYYKVKNPDPAYYQNLPSYYLRNPNNQDFAGAYLATEDLLNEGQVDWNSLYLINSYNPTARFYHYNDRNDDSTLSFNSRFSTKIGNFHRGNIGLLISDFRSESYGQMVDLLGSSSFIDKDPFSTGEASQNDLEHPNRKVMNGDKFLYDYSLRSRSLDGFIQLSANKRKFTYFTGLRFKSIWYQRNGLFRSGSFPNNSFGKGERLDFTSLSFKGGLTYKFTGRHILTLNTGYLRKAPSLNNSFKNIRISHHFNADLQPEAITLLDLNYVLRLPKINARFTGYHTTIEHGLNSRFFFAQGIRGDLADFVTETTTNISRKHRGFEWSLAYYPLSSLKIIATGNIGDYRYTNNPITYLHSDMINDELGHFGPAYLNNLHVPGTHQQAYCFGVEYNDPNYWWLQLNINQMTNNYMSISSTLRAENFYRDADGLPYIDEFTGKQVTSEQVNGLLNQQKLDDVVLVNLVGGKSWKINNTFLYFFLGVSNLLGATYRSGGFEQSRYTDYVNYQRDNKREKPLFGPKYWYGSPTTFFLNVSVKY